MARNVFLCDTNNICHLYMTCKCWMIMLLSWELCPGTIDFANTGVVHTYVNISGGKRLIDITRDVTVTQVDPDTPGAQVTRHTWGVLPLALCWIPSREWSPGSRCTRAGCSVSRHSPTGPPPTPPPPVAGPPTPPAPTQCWHREHSDTSLLTQNAVNSVVLLRSLLAVTCHYRQIPWWRVTADRYHGDMSMQTDTMVACHCWQIPWWHVTADRYHGDMSIQTDTMVTCQCRQIPWWHVNADRYHGDMSMLTDTMVTYQCRQIPWCNYWSVTCHQTMTLHCRQRPLWHNNISNVNNSDTSLVTKTVHWVAILLYFAPTALQLSINGPCNWHRLSKYKTITAKN